MSIRRSIGSLFVVFALSAVSASAAPILSIQPATKTVNVGDVFTLNIDIEDVDDLFSYNFDLTFDPAILLFQSIAEGPFPQSGLTPPDMTFFIPGTEVPPGTIYFTGNTVIGAVSGVNGSGTLAIVTFMAQAAGLTAITISDYLFINGLLDTISFDRVDTGAVQVNATTAAVPEPSTMILLATGLALAARRRFRRAV